MLVIGDETKWSEIGLLKTSRLLDQITLLNQIQFSHHGLPYVICGDQKFNEQLFRQFCQSMEVRFVSVAANHHEGNAIAERANRTISEHVARLALAENRLSLVDYVATAFHHKNISRGHQNASSFECLITARQDSQQHAIHSIMASPRTELRQRAVVKSG